MTSEEALNKAVQALLAELTPDGHWEGELSSSALAAAVAVIALHINGDAEDKERLDRGCRWLHQTQNADGGWGDCPKSLSNPSTTLLVLAAFRIVEKQEDRKADSYLQGVLGNDFASGIRRIYGEDHTFSVPILLTCALAGLVMWSDVPRLPYPLAAMPYLFYRMLRLQVVSYAMPALIAVGLAIDKKRGQQKIGALVEARVLKILEMIQPASGGFLEAVPLTSFVAFSLLSLHPPESQPPDSPVASDGNRNPGINRVLKKSVSFLRRLQRKDGSWPIDTNLSIWVTSGAIDALRTAGRIVPATAFLWLADSQTQEVHPFTHAEPGGWGWTDLSGSVPDGDDTSGVLLALSACANQSPDFKPENNGPGPFQSQRNKGLRWLKQLQNADGGWPPFCRGWGKLPFDRSCTDITAHALRALLANDQGNCLEANKGFRFLAATQRRDGSWIPLWFGSQETPDNENPVFGTSRVLTAYGEFGRSDSTSQSGIRYLLAAQNEDGGWGAALGSSSMIQESSLAVAALSFFAEQQKVRAATEKGVQRIIEFIEQGGLKDDRPIGLYFAKLWYSEKLYPIIWAVKALASSLR